jgi:hypothetical protein
MALNDVLGIQPNILENFSSYNTIFTISALTTEQSNFPDAADSYKNNNLGEIILRSGAGRPDNRIRTAYTTNDNPSGQYDFFIDNVEIQSLISFDKRTNGSNATSITFDVLEPYSMGLFLQTLQLAAAATSDNGQLASYTEAPFLLTIEFIGYDEAGNVVVVDDALNRHIPFTFSNIELDIAASGSRYKVTALPHNEDALKDSVAKLKEDVSISGLTVQEMLQTGKNSLQYRLNSQKKEIAKQGSETGKEEYVPDQYVIIFPKTDVTIAQPSEAEDEGQSCKIDPKTQGANSGIKAKLSLTQASSTVGTGNTANVSNMLIQDASSVNKIGLAEMGFTANTGGDSQPVEANRAQSNPDNPVKRKDNVYDPKDKVFRFPQGTSITNAITEVLLMSEYCKKSVGADPDKSGLKSWFRIETQVYNLEPNAGNANRARRPKLYVYKVVEYQVHEHRFKQPGAQPQGYDELKKFCVKEYNYIYSGKNVDIINFNINLKTSMFTTAYSDRNALSGQVYAQINGAGIDNKAQPTNADANKTSVDDGMPVVPVGEKPKRYRNSGGGPNDDYRSLIAKNFQEALLNSPADMLTIDIDVLGDPYYIADSGMGNFSATPANFNINDNGSMNYQSGEVDIIINFRTPLDYNSTGGLDFAQTVDATGFSGLYNVQQVTNSFKGGKFTQQLKAIRRPTQNPAKTQITAEQLVAQQNASFEYGTNEGSEQTRLLAEQDAAFADDGNSLTTAPGQAPKKAIDSAPAGTRGSQVETTDNGIAIPGNR